jgi:hypothetical protein
LEQEVEEAQWNRAISAVAERIRICEDLKAQIANAKGTQL